MTKLLSPSTETVQWMGCVVSLTLVTVVGEMISSPKAVGSLNGFWNNLICTSFPERDNSNPKNFPISVGDVFFSAPKISDVLLTPLSKVTSPANENILP